VAQVSITVQPLVALQADQVGIDGGGHGRCQRRLADARLAFEEQRPAEPKGQKERDGQPAIGDIGLVRQPLLQIGDRRRMHGHYRGR
jgi:hypothetical protein